MRKKSSKNRQDALLSLLESFRARSKNDVVCHSTNVNARVRNKAAL